MRDERAEPVQLDLMFWRGGYLAKVVLIGVACLLAVAAILAIRTTTEAQSIGDGSFIRQAGTESGRDVYRVSIVNGKRYKWLIVNWTAFDSYGAARNTVRDVSRSVMNRYARSNYARRGSDFPVWRFTASGDSGTRQWLNMTPKEFEAAGLSWDAVHSITQTDFNQYSRGPDRTCLNYRGSCQPKVDIRSSSLTYDEGDRVSSRWVATVTDRDSGLRAGNITVSGLPSGLSASFNRSNGRLTISDTLASGTAGTHQVTVRASDGRLSDEGTFRVRVRSRNSPPQISGTSDRTWREGQRVSSLQVATVTDRDSTLRSRDVTISGLPSGLAKGSYRASDGRLTISGTLAQGSAGTYTARVSASDGTHTTRKTFRIRVPHPPVVNIRSDLTYSEGDRVSSQRVATVTDRDSTLRSRDVTVTGLPSGLSGSFNTSNGYVTISGTLGTGLRRSYTATVSASDGTYTRRGTFRIDVQTQTACEVSDVTSSLSMREGQRVSSQRVAAVSATCRSASVSGLPRGLSGSFSSSNRRVTISGTPAAGSAGNYTATISANDGTRTRTATFRVSVAANPEITSLVSPSVTTGQSVGSTRVATVRDRDTSLSSLDVRVTGLPSGWSHRFNTSNGHITISGTAPSNRGTHTVTITASDGVGSDRESLQVTVEPQGEITDGSFIRQAGTEPGRDVYRVFIVNGKRFKWLIVNWTAFDSYGAARNTVRDVSQSVMNRYTTSNLGRHGSDSKVWRFTASGDTGTRQWLNLTPAQFEAAGFDWDAVHPLRTTDFNQYTEVTGPTCSDFDVCTSPPNQAPEITNVASLTLAQNVLSGWHDVATVTDPDGPNGQIDINFSGLPGNSQRNVWSHTYDSATGRVRLSAALGGVATAGTYTATISASDGTDTTSKNFSVTVRPPPDDCQISGVTPPLSLREGQQVSSQHVAAVSAECRSPSVSGLPSGLSGSFSSSNRQVTISGAPALGSAGTYTATIRASDGTRTTTATFQITVVGTGCVITDGPAMRLVVRHAARSAHLATVSECDLRNAQVQVAISPSGSGLSGNFNRSNGRVTINGTPTAQGAYRAVVTATGGGGTVNRTVRITVLDDSCPIVSTRGPFEFNRGEAVEPLWVATVTDPDDRLTSSNVRIEGLPPGLNKGDYDASSGRLRIGGTVSRLADVGTHRVTVSADGCTPRPQKTLQIAIVNDRGMDLGVLSAGEPPKRALGGWTSSDSTLNPEDDTRYTDRYRFELESHATVAIELRSSDAWSSLYLASTRSPFHELINELGSPENAARASRTLSPGSYYIYATAQSTGDTGGYVLRATIAEQPTFDSAVDEITWQRGVDATRQLPAASGGLPPYTYSLRTPSGNSAPEGMTFRANTQALTGAPLGEVGRHRITYRVTDAMGFEAEQTFHLKIVHGPIVHDSLIREDGTEDVYLVRLANDKWYKRRILNEAVFNGYRFDWRAVQDVSAATMAEYTTSKLAQLEGDSKIWQLEPTTGARHWLNMAADQFAASYDVDSVYTMNRREFNQYEEGGGISACTDDRHAREEPLAPGETWTREGEWTSNDCVTQRTAFITDHIGHYRDIYSFQVSKAVEVTIDLESDDVGTYIHLLDNSGQRVTLTDTSSNGNNARIIANLRPGETYWIRATTAARGATGSYKLIVTTAAGMAICSSEQIDLEAGADTSRRGEWATGDCVSDVSGDPTNTFHDRFLLRLSRGAKVTISLSVEGNAQPVLSVWRGNTKLTEIQPFDGTRRDEVGLLRSLGGGDYLIDVTTVSEGVTGSYTLKITTESTYEIKEDLGTLQAFDSEAVETIGSTTICAEGCPQDHYLFRITESVSVKLDSFGAGGLYQLMRNTGGSVGLLREEDDGTLTVLDNFVQLGGGNTVRRSIELPEGLYVVRLQGFAPGHARSATELLSGKLSLWPTATESIVWTAQYAPILRFDEDEQMHPVPAEAMIDNSHLMGPNDTVLSTNPSADSLSAHNSPSYYLDFFRRVVEVAPLGLGLGIDDVQGGGNGAEWKDALKDESKFVQFETPAPTAYVHFAEYSTGAEDWKSIQWWYFYVYNNADSTFFDHEGDWEAVTLWWKDTEWSAILSANGVRPTEVGFSAHDHGYYIVPDDSNNSCLPQIWRRPVAYVAANNHPGFPVAGQYGNIPGVPAYRDRQDDQNENGHDDARASGVTLTDYQVKLLNTQAWFSWQGHWGHIGGAPQGPGHGSWDEELQRQQLRRHWQMPPSRMQTANVPYKERWEKRSGCHWLVDDQRWSLRRHGVDAPPTYG